MLVYIYKVFVWIGTVLEILKAGAMGAELAEVMTNICS